MSHHPLSPGLLLQRMGRRLRHASGAIAYGAGFFMILQVLLRWTFGVNTPAPNPSAATVAFTLFSTVLSMAIAFTAGCYMLLVVCRKATFEEAFAQLPSAIGPLAVTLVQVIWRTFLWLPIVGSFLLLVDRVGFGPLVALLWIIGLILAFVRFPRLVCAAPLVLREHLSPTTALNRSEQLTKKHWPLILLEGFCLTVACLLVTVFVSAAVLAGFGLEPQSLVTYALTVVFAYATQAVVIAYLTEATESLVA
jgi:hypothetical protein